MNPIVKVCCIANPEEAIMAIECGAKALGLVGPMPSGPGVISNEMIAEIASMVPEDIMTFLLTSETSAAGIIAHQQLVGTNTIQMVDSLKEGNYSDIRNALPDINLVQVIHVIDENSVLEAKEAAKHVDYILLDSGNPNLKVKELGGTGRTHNWEISKKIRDSIDIPMFLAGGLNPDNVRQAVAGVKPFGLDLCSGVRTNGNLNRQKLNAFFEGLNNPI